MVELHPIWSQGPVTFEVKRNVRVAFPKWIESMTPVDASIVGGRLRNLQRQQVGIVRDCFAQDFEPFAIGDGFGAVEPGNVGHRQGLQDALHREHFALLGNGGLLWKAGWFTLRVSAGGGALVNGKKVERC